MKLSLFQYLKENYCSTVIENHKDDLRRLLEFNNLDGFDVSEECQAAVLEVALSINKSEIWALKMLDSNDLFPSSGLYQQNFFHYPGSMHQCLNVKGGALSPVVGKYWMLTTSQSNQSQPVTNPILGAGFLRVGRCFPSVCNDTDVISALDAYLEKVTKKTEYKGIILNSHQLEETIDLNGGDIVMIIILSLLGIIIGFSTILDVMATYFDYKVGNLHIFQGFSVYNNLIKVFSTNGGSSDGTNLSCLHGMRVMSISWVVLGHTFYEMVNLGVLTGNGGMLRNMGIFAEEGGPVDTAAITPIWNGMFNVDTFFMMSAVLVAYFTLKEMDKNKGKPTIKWIMFWVMFYVHRYIRLTAVYAIVIGLHATLLKYFADGPLSFLITKQINKCQNGWYLNLLYINNFAYEIEDVEGEMNCLGWTWYLANDMQFFLISPIIIYALWRNIKKGVFLSALLLIASTVTPFIITWNDETQYFHGSVGDFYTKPWNRYQPYIMGILLGFILYKLKDKKSLKISKWLNLVLWALAALSALTVVYGPSRYNLIHDLRLLESTSEVYPSTAERAFFNGLSKVCWCLSVGWVIFSCVKGTGGPVNSFLSWALWIPLARLSYCIYLIQYTVIFWYNSQLSYPLDYSSNLLAYLAVGNFAMCCFISLILVLWFESPCLHLEKLLFAALGMGGMPKARKMAKDGDKHAKVPSVKEMQEKKEETKEINGNIEQKTNL